MRNCKENNQGSQFKRGGVISLPVEGSVAGFKIVTLIFLSINYIFVMATIYIEVLGLLWLSCLKLRTLIMFSSFIRYYY